MHKILLAAAALSVSTSVAAQDFDLSTVEDTSQSSAWHNSQQWALTKLAADPDWTYLDGLYWRRVAGDSSGAKPLVTDTVTVHYAGTFVDGTTFDSSFDRGVPATFPLTRLVKAWQLAIPKMGVGDTIEIVTPSRLAYGTAGRGSIPGGATLLFKVELVGIEGR
nr:FKBP-type peptidyl-prolyl cis-trans isomerase [Altererythrobacter sp. ZODW24]